MSMCMHKCLSFQTILVVLLALCARSTNNEDVGHIEEVPTPISRILTNPGFHRELTTEITLEDEHRVKIIKDHTNCTLMLLETFSEGVYVDEYEVGNLERLGSGNHVHFFNQVDVEKPAYFSSKNVVLVYHSFQPQNSDRQVFNITIPVHFRYQLPSSTSTHRRVYINSPLVYISCNGKVTNHPPMQGTTDSTDNSACDHNKNNQDEDHSQCHNHESDSPSTFSHYAGWTRLLPREDQKGGSGLRIIVEIPVGQRQLEWIVTGTTLLVTMVGAGFTVYYVVKTEKKNCSTDRKSVV